MRNYSPNLLFNPVDFNFLSTPSAQINVLIKVNGNPAVCLGTCDYTFLTNTPQLVYSSISGSVVTLSLTDPSHIGYALSSVTVTIGGQPCTIINPTISPIINFQCQLPTNPNGTPTEVAGTYPPVVTVAQVGVVSNAPAVNSFTFPLSLNSLNATSGGTNGGYGLQLIGKGFPTSLVPGTTVTVCGVSATITAVDNTDAYIIMPPCTAGPQQISITTPQGTTNSLPFTYNAPPTPSSFIFTVSPQSWNPTMKGVMTITG
jgi:hypothetical protein